ncbi:MAG: histidine phosphatase family protein [Butyrivibrio sp.]|nr:histidine phosphatase family protein [Butyrivibrio sp.]
MIFYLVRHGQTDWNQEKRMQGHMDIPLNDAGIQQMNELADRIAEKGIQFDRMIVSPLKRAKKSAEIIVNKTKFNGEIIFDEDFIERSCGTLEGEVWTPELDLDDPRYKVETIPELNKRAQMAIDKYTFKEDERVMIVSHGAILTALRTVLSDYKLDFFDRTSPILQGNVLCCEIAEGKEKSIFNVFEE